jgi:Rab proteins geranylgeranyltransferase component A
MITYLYQQLLFSRGPLVELLISSNIARYAEFRCVTRVLTWLSDRLMPVPCSRADVFSTEAVSIVEKRMLMKMLTSIVGYNEEEMNNEFKGRLESYQFRYFPSHTFKKNNATLVKEVSKYLSKRFYYQ